MNDIEKRSPATSLANYEEIPVRSLIYTVRDQQVMLDSDLAKLYGVETKVFNQAVKRNEARFPERFRFQLTADEYDALRSQFVTSNTRGGRRYLPYAFTEQGIAMLASVLKSDTAIDVSISIMDGFVQMRRFLSSNAAMLERINSLEIRQITSQKDNDEKFDRIFSFIDDHTESKQKVFFDGQVFDAFSKLTDLVREAETNLVLIDGYVGLDTLNILSKKRQGVSVEIYTQPGRGLTDIDVQKFNAQYPTLHVHKTKAFHDRFLILDRKRTYHIGASLKDAGKKCFAISLIEDKETTNLLLARLESEA